MAVTSPVQPSPKKPDTPIITIAPCDSSSATTTSSSVKSNTIYPSPRKPRFAEATSVYSPIEPAFTSNNPFATYHAQAQPADVGLDYVPSMGVEVPITPFSPLRSAMRLPNEQAGAGGGMLSPTFREERLLEKREESTEKEQAKDLKVKVRVRIAKILLRSTNFACSFIVLSMLSTTFSIFNATKDLPARNNLPPWAPATKIWPQMTLLVIACISLLLSIIVLWRYRRGNQKRVEKAAIYYNTFSMAFFGFNIVMWLVGAGILHSSHVNGNGKDIWGWSCNDNTRKKLFDNQVSYDLVCRFQQWSLVCAVIEIIVEVLTISVSLIIFYRLWSKRRLRKAMATRDRARSDLHLAHLNLQSQPNTPGYGLQSEYAMAQHAVVSSDVYTNPFLTPAPLTAQPLLTSGYRAAEEGRWMGMSHAQSQRNSEYQGQSQVQRHAAAQDVAMSNTAEIVSGSPGRETVFAAPQAKPFILAAAPKKGKGAASKSGSGVSSPSGFSPGLGSPVEVQERSSIVPTPTEGMRVQRPVSHAGAAGSEEWWSRNSAAEDEGSRQTLSYFLSEHTVVTHMPAAPGEQVYEDVPIPAAYAGRVPSP